ncbi:MAG TPA: PfkB family carbohydrate kinase [Nocardioides sp.]|nr:PfkB family carbohydrate kinase [Nocardioides sp.]
MVNVYFTGINLLENVYRDAVIKVRRPGGVKTLSPHPTNTSAHVVVVGSSNLDLVYGVPHIPAAGETVLAQKASRHPGGKGLNQAVASARAGARTTFVTALGSDEAAAILLDTMTDAGIDERLVRRTEGPSGTALITVQPDGENSIVVSGAANRSLERLTETDREVISSAAVVVVQLEVPMSVVVETARVARSAGTTFVLNAAPAQQLGAELVEMVDVLVVNEVEAEMLADSIGAARAGVVTLGANGARWWQDGAAGGVTGLQAQVVDTTGAGDTFVGALAASLAQGRSLPEAVERGVVAGAISVERAGAVPSIPSSEEIEARRQQPDPDGPRTRDLPTLVPLDPEADLSVLDTAKILAAPDDLDQVPAWRASLRRWRTEARQRTAYDDSGYARVDWPSRAWNVAMVWLWDEAIYDWDDRLGTRAKHDPDRLLEAYAGFGGLDAVVLWHAYPVIGIDERNQFDWYRHVPGLADLVEGLHDRGVRVFLDYNPWDVGTRRTARPDAVELAALVEETGADGVFLDTLREGGSALVETLGALEPPVVLEGESPVPLAGIADHQASWAQWFADSRVPGVLRARWFEQRHMMHHTRRWTRDRRPELHSAWVNGAGVLIWDVVFGVWVGWSERDLATLRAMRRVHLALGDHLVPGDWEPLAELAPGVAASGVHGSRWTLDGTELWTVVNRSDAEVTGPLLQAHDPTSGVLVDVVSGRDLGTRRSAPVHLPAGGVGGVLWIPDGVAAPAGLDRLRAEAASDSASIAGATADFPEREPRRVTTGAAQGVPQADALRLTPGRRTLSHRYRQRETGMYETPYVESWKPLPPRLHGIENREREVDITAVAVDAAEVTNADYAAFVAATGYRPAEPNRFLAHWVDGRPEPGTEAQPVTYVDLDDARAYAAWRDARLPTEDEWQVAAGEEGFVRRAPAVWSWTESEHRDGRTRWVVLKGGAEWAATGSEWYVDGGVQDPDWSLRLLLAGGGLGRSAWIGFRCTVDLREEMP